MSLHSVSVMVVVPLVLAVGAVILLTPKDILRQRVLPVAETETGPTYTEPRPPAPTRIAVVQFDQPIIQPASLVVLASAPEPPSWGDTVPGRSQPVSPELRWITASGLNVRSGPGVRSGLIASLPYGTAVEVIETSGSWAHVQAGDVTGWLSTRFLSDREPQAR